MNYSQKQHSDSSEGSQTIRIELPSGAFSGMRRMMADFMRAAEPESGCCEPTVSRCCPESNDEARLEFTVIIGRKE